MKHYLKLLVALTILFFALPSYAQENPNPPPKEEPIPPEDEVIPEDGPPPEDPKDNEKKAVVQKVKVTNGLLDLDVKDLNLRDFADKLSQSTGKNVLVGSEIDKKLTLKLGAIPWEKALFFIADMLDCRIEERAPSVLLITKKRKKSYYFKEMEIRKVLFPLAKIAHKNILIGPHIQGKVRIDLKNVSVKEVMNRATSAAGRYEIQEDVDCLRVVPVTPSVGDQKIDQFKAASFIPRPHPFQQRNKGKRIDIDVVDLDLHALMAQISKKTGAKIVVSKDLSDKVNLTLREIPYGEAIAVIAQIVKAHLSERDGVIYLELRKKIDIHNPELKITKLIEKLTQLTGRKIVYPPNFKGSIAISVKQLTAHKILGYLAVAMGDYTVVDLPGKPLQIVKKAPKIKEPKTEPQNPIKEKVSAAPVITLVKEAFKPIKTLLKAGKQKNALGLSKQLYQSLTRNKEGYSLSDSELDIMEAELLKQLLSKAFTNFPKIRWLIMKDYVTGRGQRLIRRLHWDLRFLRLKSFQADEKPAKKFVEEILNPLLDPKNRPLKELARTLKKDYEQALEKSRGLQPLMTMKLHVNMSYSKESESKYSDPFDQDAKATAIIDGRTYKVGDPLRNSKGQEIPGVTIRAIQHKTVELAFNGYGPFIIVEYGRCYGD